MVKLSARTIEPIIQRNYFFGVELTNRRVHHVLSIKAASAAAPLFAEVLPTRGLAPEAEDGLPFVPDAARAVLTALVICSYSCAIPVADTSSMPVYASKSFMHVSFKCITMVTTVSRGLIRMRENSTRLTRYRMQSVLGSMIYAARMLT